VRFAVVIAVAGCGFHPQPEQPPPTSCALPQLLVAASAPSGTLGGGVARVALGAAGATQTCSVLTADGTLPAEIDAVTWVGGDVVAATAKAAYGLDPIGDKVAFSADAPVGMTPVDAYGLAVNSTAPGLMVGFGAGEIDRVEGYRTDGIMFTAFDASSAFFPTGAGTRSITAEPVYEDDGFLLASGKSLDLMFFNHVASDIFDAPTGADLISVFATAESGRSVWVDRAVNGVRWLASGGTAMQGPISCPMQACTLAHAVFDPTDDHAFFALCVDASDGRRVLRLDDAGGCAVILDGTMLPYRLGRLGLATQN
jgi:hypothetical protein